MSGYGYTSEKSQDETSEYEPDFSDLERKHAKRAPTDATRRASAKRRKTDHRLNIAEMRQEARDLLDLPPEGSRNKGPSRRKSAHQMSQQSAAKKVKEDRKRRTKTIEKAKDAVEGGGESKLKRQLMDELADLGLPATTRRRRRTELIEQGHDSEPKEDVDMTTEGERMAEPSTHHASPSQSTSKTVPKKAKDSVIPRNSNRVSKPASKGKIADRRRIERSGKNLVAALAKQNRSTPTEADDTSSESGGRDDFATTGEDDERGKVEEYEKPKEYKGKTFTDLPPESRNQVYEELIKSEKESIQLTWRPNLLQWRAARGINRWCRSDTCTLTQTCKTIRYEYLPLIRKAKAAKVQLPETQQYIDTFHPPINPNEPDKRVGLRR
ncbi:hypothetical protein CC80DRAFT_574910 [Byssothecium circinans]|uniref:Uncharacterized protein n=1 Tax=Byssothecium circinans TaxID=147558 RepID=A0A6A5TRI3_9PLEO|nr:hypothetical protein CC80DRAFT_574910 [Byssothecium circinans]